jgi:hypothetical protein
VALALGAHRRALRSRAPIGLALPFALALAYAWVLGDAVDASRPRAIAELGTAALSLLTLGVALALPASLPRPRGSAPVLPARLRVGQHLTALAATCAGLWAAAFVSVAVGASALLLAIGALADRAFAAPIALVLGLGAGVAAGRFGLPPWPLGASALLGVSAWAASMLPAEQTLLCVAALLSSLEAALVLAAGLCFRVLARPSLAFALTLGWVALGREAGVLSALAGAEGPSPDWAARALSMVLPRLDRYASPASLLPGVPGARARAGWALAHTLVWALVLLGGAGLLAHRRRLMVRVRARE